MLPRKRCCAINAHKNAEFLEGKQGISKIEKYFMTRFNAFTESPTEKPDKNRRTSSIKPDKILSLVDQLGAEMFIQTSAINGKGICFLPQN